MECLHLSDILYREWDPIKVKGLAPADEYQSYAEDIIKIIDEGGGREEVLRLLDRIRVDEMNLGSNPREDIRVFNIIEAYRQDFIRRISRSE